MQRIFQHYEFGFHFVVHLKIKQKIPIYFIITKLRDIYLIQ